MDFLLYSGGAFYALALLWVVVSAFVGSNAAKVITLVLSLIGSSIIAFYFATVLPEARNLSQNPLWTNIVLAGILLLSIVCWIVMFKSSNKWVIGFFGFLALGTSLIIWSFLGGWVLLSLRNILWTPISIPSPDVLPRFHHG